MRTRYKNDRSYDGLDFVVTTISPHTYHLDCSTFTKKSMIYDDTMKERKQWTKDIFGHRILVPRINQKKIRPDFACLHKQAALTSIGKWPTVNHEWYAYPGLTITMNVPSVSFRMPETFAEPPLPDVADDYIEFIKNASLSFQQQFKSELSIANFAYELKDFKKQGERMSHAAQGLIEHKSFRAAKSALRDETKDRIRNGIGGNYLDYHLNWKSLISDVPKCFEFYRKAMQRLEILIGYSQYTEHKSLRFLVPPGENGFERIDVLDVDAVAPPPGYQYKLWLEPIKCQVTFHVSAVMDNALHTEAFSLWDVMADQLGLNNSPKILWNATKLSWVADMFLDSRTFFDEFEKQALNGALSVQKGCASQKIEQSYAVMVRKSISGGTFDVQVAILTFKHYERQPLETLKTGYFGLHKKLNDDQGRLLGALASTMAGVDRRRGEYILEIAAAGKKKFRAISRLIKKGRGRRPPRYTE